MRNQILLFFACFALGWVHAATAQPLAPPSLGGRNDTLGALVVGTVVGALLFWGLTSFGESLTRSKGRPIYAKIFMALGAAAWVGTYFFVFSL